MKLQAGDRIMMRDALYAMMLSSDNLAALTVANHVGQQLLISRAKRGEPVREFVDEMNRLAKGLGMKHTRFANPHGLEREGVIEPGLTDHELAAETRRYFRARGD